jgi:hypothetical protein
MRSSLQNENNRGVDCVFKERLEVRRSRFPPSPCKVAQLTDGALQVLCGFSSSLCYKTFFRWDDASIQIKILEQGTCLDREAACKTGK